MKHRVFLTDTDTAVGFVSQDASRLDAIKARPSHKRYITVLPSLRALKAHTRIPKAHATLVRRARKTTLIFPNGRSYRVINDRRHVLLLERLGWAYSTSANRSGEAYDETFAKEAADVTVLPLRAEGAPSTILKLGKQRYKRIR